jgi:hypothetical protein
MLSWHPSEYPVAVVQGGPSAGRVLYAHLEQDPAKLLPHRPSTLFTADEFAAGRRAVNLDDLDDVYHALDHGMPPPPHLAPLYARVRDEATKRAFRQFRLEGAGKLAAIPQAVPNQREMPLLMAPSGAGKSTWIANYVEGYRCAFPDNDVVLFTSKTDPDPAFEGLDIEPVDLERFGEEAAIRAPGPEDFRDSLIVFDDIESISPKSVRDAVFALKKSLAETGRSSNVYLCVSAHRAMRGQETKDDLNEASGYVVFPRRGSSAHSKRLLETYGGLTKQQVKRVLEQTQGSRWAYCKIKGETEPYVVTENEVFFL